MSSSDLNSDWELVGSPPIAIIIGGEMIARAGACSSGGFPAHTLNKKSSACIFQLQPPALRVVKRSPVCSHLGLSSTSRSVPRYVSASGDMIHIPLKLSWSIAAAGRWEIPRHWSVILLFYLSRFVDIISAPTDAFFRYGAICWQLELYTNDWLTNDRDSGYCSSL